MSNVSSHINYAKSVIIMLMVLFALTPCTVKESAYQLVNVEYQRPLNQTKSTHISSSSCELYDIKVAFIFSSEQSQVVVSSHSLQSSSILSLTEPIEIQGFLSEYLNKRLEVSFSPLYILYSRLKIALG